MEKVTYRGRVYSRDPNAKNLSRRTYYRRQKYDSRTKKYIQTLLHRVIWEDHNGPIPYENIVHHIDGNPDNNNLSNLACIPLRDHLSKYHGEGKYKNAKERSCDRCGSTFKAKTKRSKLCFDCITILDRSGDERRKWDCKKKNVEA